MIDLSHRISDKMPVFPGDRPLSLTREKAYENNGYTTYALHSCMHAGTHIDAPSHLSSEKRLISDYCPDIFYGRAVALDCRNEQTLGVKEDFRDKIEENGIVVICTEHYRYFDRPELYYGKYPSIGENLCELFIHKKIKMLALDTPSPDGFPFELHKRLSASGIFIVENIKNSERLLEADSFMFFAVPLNIEAEASLVRAFAIMNPIPSK